MKNGIKIEIDWAYMGALLANQDSEEQAKFFKAMLKECDSWETKYQAQMQFAMVNEQLTNEEKETISMLGYAE